MAGIYEADLTQQPANYRPLTPLNFLDRSAMVYPDHIAVIDGHRQFTYRQFKARCLRLASALSKRGIGVGDTVAVMAPNVPALLEAHYGVPMCGAVLNALNTRLDAATVAFILEHAEAKILIAHKMFADVVRAAVDQLGYPLSVIEIHEGNSEENLEFGALTYEALLQKGDANFVAAMPETEWQAIALNYTSGTTGNPKGVVYHHRGAYLAAMGNQIAMRLDHQCVYLWTLPMFHCNGWTFTWAVTAAGGTHVCLPRVDPQLIFAAIAQHRVSHMCGAPVVLNALINAPSQEQKNFPQTVEVATGGAAPPSAVIRKMEALGFRVTHLYGLTETYGPATICEWQTHWEALPSEEQATKVARQGVRYHTLDDATILDPNTLQTVPWDGETLGELMVRGHTVMKGYLKNPSASQQALQGGWFHTGDLGVIHPDGYMEIKDRAKDIIISGGENISSLEVEEVLYRHPQVVEAAVVARADEKWGETPCAFVTLRAGVHLNTQAIIDFCRDNMARFKAPKTVVFGELPKTATGKIQKNILRARAAELAE